MKKLLLVILIITLPLITFFQYKNYRRFHPPVAYEYAISDSLDLDYHDHNLVDEYFTKSVEIGSFARARWRNEGIDVRFPDQDSAPSLNAAKKYNQLLVRLLWLESKLKRSYELKKAGFNNEEVKYIESGVSTNVAKWMSEKDAFISLSVGSRGEYVWVVQERLIQKGYNHNLDGVFGIDTQNAIVAFQNDNTLYPSGDLNESTFKKLFTD